MAYNCPHCQTAIPDAVSKGELTGKINKHNAATDAMEKQIESLQKQTSTSTRAHKAALQTLREELTSGHSSALAMARMGFDEEGTAVAELLHGRLPESGRPALTDWLQGMKDNPSSAHVVLKAYFGDTPETTETATETTAPTKTATAAATLPPPSGKPVNGTSPQWTPESIANMSDTEFRANLGALSQAAGFDVASMLGLDTEAS